MEESQAIRVSTTVERPPAMPIVTPLTSSLIQHPARKRQRSNSLTLPVSCVAVKDNTLPMDFRKRDRSGSGSLLSPLLGSLPVTKIVNGSILGAAKSIQSCHSDMRKTQVTVLSSVAPTTNSFASRCSDAKYDKERVSSKHQYFSQFFVRRERSGSGDLIMCGRLDRSQLIRDQSWPQKHEFLASSTITSSSQNNQIVPCEDVALEPELVKICDYEGTSETSIATESHSQRQVSPVTAATSSSFQSRFSRSNSWDKTTLSKSRPPTPEIEPETDRRERLCPTSALISFCRMMTFCRVSKYEDAGSSSRVQPLVLLSSWYNLSDIPKIESTYEDYRDYMNTFIWSICEECRMSLMKGSLDDKRDNTPSRLGVSRDAFIVSRIQKGDSSAMRDPKGARVNVGRVYQLLTELVESDESESLFSNGDFVLLRSSSWTGTALGLIDTWDADTDSFGISSQRKFSNPSILVCVSEAGLVDEDRGGWLPSVTAIERNQRISVSTLGNVMTSLREYQALYSMKKVNKNILDLLINPGQAIRVNSLDLSEEKTGLNLSKPESVPQALWTSLTKEFNPSQLSAIRMACGRCGDLDGPSDIIDLPIKLLQGPPGTGKTKVILGLVSVFLSGTLSKKKRTGTKIFPGRSLSATSSSNERILHSNPKNKSRILICAQSNIAIDEIVLRLNTQGYHGEDGYPTVDPNIVRIGTASSQKVSNPQSFSSPSKMDDFLYSSSMVDRSNIERLVEDRRTQYFAANEKCPSLVDLRKDIIENADIVCATLSGAGSQPLLELALRIPNFSFDAVIIDEAAQAVEPSSLIPFKFNPQVIVLVGDPKQLPATILSPTAKLSNYTQSLFQRLFSAGYPHFMLDTQYRMHEFIAEFPSHHFYDRKLKCSRSVSAGSYDKEYHSDPKFRPFVFHDVLSSRQVEDGSGFSNAEEVKYIVELYDRFRQLYPKDAKEVGIIAPYQSQVAALNVAMQRRFGDRVKDYLEIKTVDGFQGREKDIVILSCVRGPTSNNDVDFGDGNIGFLREWQRLNVAITRSKYALWIVGHADTLSRGDRSWNSLVNHAKTKRVLYRHESTTYEDSRNFQREDRPLIFSDRGTLETRKQKRSLSTDSSDSKKGNELCIFFNRGCCKFGMRCRFIHKKESDTTTMLQATDAVDTFKEPLHITSIISSIKSEVLPLSSYVGQEEAIAVPASNTISDLMSDINPLPQISPTVYRNLSNSVMKVPRQLSADDSDSSSSSSEESIQSTKKAMPEMGIKPDEPSKLLMTIIPKVPKPKVKQPENVPQETVILNKKKRSNSTDSSHDNSLDKKARSAPNIEDISHADSKNLMHVVLMKGLSSKATKEEVEDFLFVNHVEGPLCVDMSYDANGRSKGSALVSLSGSHNLQCALSLDGEKFYPYAKVVKITIHTARSKGK